MGSIASLSPRLFCSCFALSLFAGMAFVEKSQGAAIQEGRSLEKVSKEISNVENEILREDTRNVAAQVQRLRRLITLQKKEIKLSEKKIQDMNGRLKSFSSKRKNLEDHIAEEKRGLYRSFKKSVGMVEGLLSQQALIKWDLSQFTRYEEEQEKSRFLSHVSLRELNRLKNYRTSYEQLLALEERMGKEIRSLEYFSHELQEKLAVLAENEKFQQGLLKSKKWSLKTDLARLGQLKERKKQEEEISRVVQSQMPVDSSLAQSAFFSLKGRLPPPVVGEIVSQYGRFYDPKTSLLTFQKGISIRPKDNIFVKSVFSGKVVYSGFLKNYGQMVIIEHEGQFFTLYGQLGLAKVREGQKVSQGEILGQTHGAKEPLYFEIREKSIAINPLQWLDSKNISMMRGSLK